MLDRASASDHWIQYFQAVVIYCHTLFSPCEVASAYLIHLVIPGSCQNPDVRLLPSQWIESPFILLTAGTAYTQSVPFCGFCYGAASCLLSYLINHASSILSNELSNTSVWMLWNSSLFNLLHFIIVWSCGHYYKV